MADRHETELAREIMRRGLTRRQILKYGVTLGLSSSGMLALLAACGQAQRPQTSEGQAAAGSAPPATAGASAPTTAETAAPAGTAAADQGDWPSSGVSEPTSPVEISVAHSWDASFWPRQEEFDRQFMERHPNIRVRSENTPFSEYLQKYLTQAAAGTLPDLMYMQFAWAQQLIQQGSLIELDNYIAQASDFNREDFTEPSLVSYQSNDKLYGIPYDEGPGILFYNKNIFDNAGVAYPDETWTLETLKETAIKLTSGEGPNKIYGLADTPVPGTTMAPPYLYPFGAAFITEPEEDQCLINSPEAKQAMEWWMELRLQHNAVPSPGDVQTLSWPAFQHGRIAMFLEGTWATPPIHENANFNWDVAMWPKGPEAHSTFSAGSAYAITKDSKNQDAAWIYLNEYISTPGQIFMWASTGRGSPSRISAWDAYLESEFAPPNARVALESLNTIASHEIMDKPTGPRVSQRINPIWDLVVNGQLGVSEALDQICQEIDPILAENRA